MIIVKVQVEAIFSDLDLYTSSVTETVAGEDKEKCIENACIGLQNKAYIFEIVSKEVLIETYSAELIDGVYKPTKSLSIETRQLNFC